MPDADQADRGPLAAYRDYLRLLAGAQLGPRLRQKLDPSDLVHATLLKAHQHWPKLRAKTERECAAWLRRIMANTLADELRRFGPGKRDLALEQSLEQSIAQSSARLESLLAAGDSTPSGRAARHEDHCRLAEALAALPTDQRTAIELHHLGGLAVAAVAIEMDKSEAAVAGLLRRGLKSLRARLGDC